MHYFQNISRSCSGMENYALIFQVFQDMKETLSSASAGELYWLTNPICGTQRTTHVSPRIVPFNMTEYNTRDKVFHKSSQQSSSQCDCAWAYHRLMFSHGKIEPRELCLQAWLCLPVELWRLTCLRLHGHHKSNHNVHSFKCLSGFGFVPER